MTRLIVLGLLLIASCQSKKNTAEQAAEVQPETSIIVKWDTLTYKLQHCSASMEGENLKLYIERQPDSISDYAIEIYQKDKRFDVLVSQPWSVTDTSYIAPRFKILSQQLKLDKENYQPNDKVEGEINLLLLGHKAYFREEGEMKLRESLDTVRFIGVFGSIVK